MKQLQRHLNKFTDKYELRIHSVLVSCQVCVLFLDTRLSIFRYSVQIFNLPANRIDELTHVLLQL